VKVVLNYNLSKSIKKTVFQLRESGDSATLQSNSKVSNRGRNMTNGRTTHTSVLSESCRVHRSNFGIVETDKNSQNINLRYLLRIC